MMKILIIDDEPLAIERLQSLVIQLGHNAIVGHSPEHALAQSPQCDVALVDIEMPQINGLKLASALQCPVIFCTAHEQYAIEAFNSGALHYLTKPIRQHRLEEALARVNIQQQAVSFQCVGSIWRLDWSQVLQAYSDSKLTIVQTLSEQKVVNSTLTELEAQQPDKWLRVSRSVLINPQHVTELHNESLILTNLIQPITISRRLRSDVHKRLKS